RRRSATKTSPVRRSNASGRWPARMWSRRRFLWGGRRRGTRYDLFMANLKIRFLTAVFLLLLPLLAAAADPPAAQPAAPPQTPAEVLKHANELLVASKFSEAEAEYRRAESLSGAPCGECALGLATVRASEGKWSESADLIQRSLPLLTAPALLSRAY